MRTFLCVLPLALLPLAGCSSAAKKTENDEEAVKAAVAELQKAIKAKDGDAIWNLLDAESQADAERQAKAARDAYAAADEAGKKDLAERSGLDGAALAALN